MIYKYSLFSLFVAVLQRFHEQLANTESLLLGKIQDLKCSRHISVNWSTHLCLTCFLFKDTCRCVPRNLWRTPQDHVPNDAYLTHIFCMRYITGSFHLGALDCASVPLGFHSKRINHKQSTRKRGECGPTQTVGDSWHKRAEGFKTPTAVCMSATDWRELHDCRGVHVCYWLKRAPWLSSLWYKFDESMYLQVWDPQTMALCT